MLLLEGKRRAEKDIIELENPEKQLQRIIRFYQNLGANYTKNQWLSQTEQEITFTNKGENSRLSLLIEEVKTGNIFEKAVTKKDDESIRALIEYKKRDEYKSLVDQIMFYIGVSKAQSEIDYIEKACTAITRRYPPINTSAFIKEGVHYYVYYLQCLQICLKKYRNHFQYELVQQAVRERCMNLKLMLNMYKTDDYIYEEVQQILTEISNAESLLNDYEKEDAED